MNSRRVGFVLICCSLAVGMGATLRSAETPADDVQIRGPLHEAFAQPVNPDPARGLVVGRRPPEPIREAPSALAPQDPATRWIPGYWSWNDDRNDFLWVSGIWRRAPEGRRWVPGYWAETKAGFQWVSGMWVEGHADALDYLPLPPRSLEVGPTSPLPSPHHFWSSGHWTWDGREYNWQPGEWREARQRRVWVPAQFAWTPLGAVFNPGYWDFVLGDRGLLLAPREIRTAAEAQLRPDTVINSKLLPLYLFTRPAYGHYYFGDYYDPHYARLGIYPWFGYYARNGVYDPLYTYQSWAVGKRTPAWWARMNRWYEQREVHANLRPPATLAQQQALVARVGQPAGHLQLAAALRPHTAEVFGWPLVQLSNERESAIEREVAQWDELDQARRETELAGAARMSDDLRGGRAVLGHLDLPMWEDSLSTIVTIARRLPVEDESGPSEAAANSATAESTDPAAAPPTTEVDRQSREATPPAATERWAVPRPAESADPKPTPPPARQRRSPARAAEPRGGEPREKGDGGVIHHGRVTPPNAFQDWSEASHGVPGFARPDRQEQTRGSKQFGINGLGRFANNDGTLRNGGSPIGRLTSSDFARSSQTGIGNSLATPSSSAGRVGYTPTSVSYGLGYGAPSSYTSELSSSSTGVLPNMGPASVFSVVGGGGIPSNFGGGRPW